MAACLHREAQRLTRFYNLVFMHLFISYIWAQFPYASIVHTADERCLTALTAAQTSFRFIFYDFY